MLAFTIIIVYSKHLHIFLAPVNVSAKRLPKALGPAGAVRHEGKPIDFEDPPEDARSARQGRGLHLEGDARLRHLHRVRALPEPVPGVEHRQAAVPQARDHGPARPPVREGALPHRRKRHARGGGDRFLGGNADGQNGHHGVPESGFGRVHGSGPEQAARPLVGTAEAGGVIDPDVLWSCTTCGACVEQCPVDIEHVDHIVDMRRYQVMIESEFPSELGVLFRNLENKGNPWGQNARNRLDWTKDLPFEVPVYDGELSAETEYLFWVGCAGAFDDKAQKTVRATAELLHRAGWTTSCSARRRPAPVTPPGGRATSSCSRCSRRRTSRCSTPSSRAAHPAPARSSPPARTASTPWAASTPAGRPLRGRAPHPAAQHAGPGGPLVPVAAPDGDLADVTYHDPCYLGRHNEVYAEPRELVGASGVRLTEMPRHADRSFCCGAGGARMWMEEKIGKRVNLERVDEALGTGAEKIATGCPFCRVMFSDGLTQRQSEQQGTDVEILDVSQLLLAAVTRGDVAPPDEVDALGAGAPGSRPLPCPARRSTAPARRRPSRRTPPATSRWAAPAPAARRRGARTRTRTGPDADPPR
jgi:Fe-S oxidoreductase